MLSLFENIDKILGSYPFIFAAVSASFIFKTILFFILLFKSKQASKSPKSFLIAILISAMFIDSAWLFVAGAEAFSLTFNYYVRILWLRMSWAFNAVQYVALTLFMERLIESNSAFNPKQKFLLVTHLTFFSFFVGFALLPLFSSWVTPEQETLFRHFYNTIQHIFIIGSSILLLCSAIFNLWKIKQQRLPKILKTQLKVFIQWIILPFWFCEFLQTWPAILLPKTFSVTIPTHSHSAVSIGALLLTFAMYYCTKRIIGLRFLNFRNHVETKTRLNFIDGFKSVLERLSHATSFKELQHLVQMSFKDLFQVPITRIHLHLCTSANGPNEQQTDLSHIESTVENFLLLQKDALQPYIKHNRILIYDEIAFSDFYEQSAASEKILAFLDNLNADIFIPIHTQQKVIGYIVIDRFARQEEFYSNVEHDEMAVFASYLANVINLLQNRNLERLIHQEKMLQEELYSKHQEINQYKESVRTFLRHNNQTDIGIIFYKNRRFAFGNEASKKLINVNINQHQGHPITQKLKRLARNVQEYKSPQSDSAKDKDGNRLILSAVPHLEQNNVIIIVYYPEISDLVKKQIALLKDPSNWDFLLYLETTESGKLINQLIPGSGEQILNFKIDLLRAALSRKAILLEMPEEDLLPTVKLFHHISLREQLHVLKVMPQSDKNDIATKLFGINPIFGTQNNEVPIMQKLNENGTLFIQNIHLLNIEIQEYFSEYLRYGMYRLFKSDRRVSSDVRIICSTNKDLHIMVQEGTFNKQLYNQLSKHTITMPSLYDITEDELHELAQGYTDQSIEADDFKNLLELTDKEKHKLAKQRPVSLHELKNKVQHLLINKSKKNQIYDETQFDPAFETSDPELIKAARLGKHALRDERIMTLLWNKFQSQSKIASFLGVNRSSVNRRCKQYNLDA